MNKIKVWLQYPWAFPDSPYYKYLLGNPPENIEYMNVQKQKGVITSWKKFAFMNKIKNILRKGLYLIKRPNIIRTKKGDYDVIHCAHCLSKNKIPWIVDVEHYWNFASSGELAYSKTGKEKIKKMLKKDYCKKILPWTESAKESLIEALKDREIEKKIEVVYPAIQYQNIKKLKKKGITLLFIGRYFYGKGGLHALEAFDNITKRFPEVNAIFVSEVPQEILKKYLPNKKIKFYNLMSQKELFKLYSQSDIFVYPGYSDTFGFALLEAMSFGLPIITVDGFARKEIVQDGKTGFVIDFDQDKLEGVGKRKNSFIVKNLIEKCTSLIKNKKIREKMSLECSNLFKRGKFSINERNKKLKKIYDEALK